jgi:DNA-binding Lrp family transcriptional regulator
MKVSEREMQVAAIAQFRRDETVSSLARRAGMRSHNFLYALRRLQAAGVLRPWVFINPFKIGYEEIELLFTIGSGAQRQRTQFQNFLQTHPQVIWYGSLGGDYQYGVRIIADGPMDCQKFLEEIDLRFHSLVARKSLVHILSFTSLPKRYLNRGKRVQSAPGIEIKPDSKRAELDSLDYKILQALLASPLASEREVARVTGYARATVAAHLAKLRREGVLLGSVFLIGARSLGYHAYRMLIYGRGVRQDLTKKISQFVEAENSVVNVTHCLGEWDFELSIEVQDPMESAEKVSALYDHCGASVERIELLPVFEQGVSHRFLAGKSMLT